MPGLIVVTVQWVDPPPGEAISIGGYAFFGRLTGGAATGPEFELSNDRSFQVGAGTYQLELWTRSQSDAIRIEEVPGGTPRLHRDFGPIEAQCRQTIVVPPGGELRLVFRATAGRCEIVLAR